MCETPLPAGRLLDAEVARRVMGIKKRDLCYAKLAFDYGAGPPWQHVPRPDPVVPWQGWVECEHTKRVIAIPAYSTDIAAAWQVYLRAVETFGHAAIICDMEDYGREPGEIVTVIVGLGPTWSYTGSAATAICQATLAAFQDRKEQSNALSS